MCMQVSGEVLYNGVPEDQFVMGRTAAYVDQTDNHIAELTVRGRLLPPHLYLPAGRLHLLVVLPNVDTVLQNFSRQM